MNDVFQVVGFQRVSGTSKNTGNPYSGYQIFLTYQSPKVSGYGSERVYIGDQALNGFVPELGQRVELRYNRWGNVSEIKVV